RDPPEPILVPDCDPGRILDHAQPVSESPDLWPRGFLAVLWTRPRHRRVAHAPGPRFRPAVIGNSGSGKSSLIQAGLIPALRRGRFRCDGKTVDSWRIAVFRPSADPFDYLAETLPRQLAPELSAAERDEFIDRCKRKLPAGGDELRNKIVALPPEATHVLLVADQFEELFTLVPDPAIRNLYIDSLLAAARRDGA